MKKHRKKMRPMKLLAIGFAMIIFIGTVLLMLPFASRNPGSVSFLEAWFTATSATCVTGLVVKDTYQHWTLFGQIIILALIQIGGLGFMTIGVYISVILKKKIGLAEREAIHESVSTIEVAGVVRLVKRIIQGTFIFEGLGAVILAIRFIPQEGFLKGVYYGIFHSISAFCNAGFDLMGSREAYSSFVDMVGDPIINLTLMLLIIIGGIGFIVWDDVYRNKWHIKKYLLHTKIVLTMTVLLVFGGAIFIYIFERNNLFADMTAAETIFGSLFASVTARTAGFNTIDVAAMTSGSKLITMFLMFIGGSPGSTAGGVKTTTLVVSVLFAISTVRHTVGSNIAGKRLEDEIIKKANAVMMINFSLAFVGAAIIFVTQNLNFEAVMFEVFSAIGTVGMTTGITRDLNSVSRIVIILLMYFGRVGSLTFAITFAQKKIVPYVQYPTEKIIVG